MNNNTGNSNSIFNESVAEATSSRQGWTSGPATRGTMDIVWSCTLTTFLCCWSVLVVNVPGPGSTSRDIVKRKLFLLFVCAVVPEYVFQMALGQWLSAQRSVRLFHESGHTDWTLRHAFYADMGGIHLESPDWKSFPVNALQLHHLISKDYIRYPKIADEHIRDKNKVDGMLRAITLSQTIWFTINMIFRAVQHLPITAFELSTSAFVLLSIATTICWMRKPADVQSFDLIRTEHTIAQILQDGGEAAKGLYNFTPLDFVGRQAWAWSIMWVHGLEYLRKMKVAAPPSRRPITRFQNTIVPVVDGWYFWIFTGVSVAYFSIFIAGWNLEFPTRTERLLWRAASLSALLSALAIGGTLHIYWPLAPRVHLICRRLAGRVGDEVHSQHEPPHINSSTYQERGGKITRLFAYLRNNSLLQDPNFDCPAEAVIAIWGSGILYVAARLYIIIADFTELRSLPRSTYENVDWSSYWPHF